jgi:hypothetical protein
MEVNLNSWLVRKKMNLKHSRRDCRDCLLKSRRKNRRKNLSQESIRLEINNTSFFHLGINIMVEMVFGL